MTLSGKEAVKKAFENASGSQWATVRDEYIATRVKDLYDPFSVDDLDAGSIALDLVRRAYLNGLREAQKAEGASRLSCVQREAACTLQLMDMFDRETNPEWVKDTEREHIEGSVKRAFRAGCAEGRIAIGSVI